MLYAYAVDSSSMRRTTCLSKWSGAWIGGAMRCGPVGLLVGMYALCLSRVVEPLRLAAEVRMLPLAN